jgi:hypothetical protein
MASREQVTDPATLPLALAFEVVRRHRRDLLPDPRRWLEVIVGTASPREILAEASAYLDTDRPVELSQWVMDDMPSGEVQIIDDRGDLLRASLIAMAMTTDPQQQDLDLIPTRTLALLRDRVQNELTALLRDTDMLETEYRIAGARERLQVIEASLNRAFNSYERAGRDRLRAAELDGRATSLIRTGIETEWKTGFPQILLGQSVHEAGEWHRGVAYLGIRSLELKEFFVTGELEPDTMSMMSSTWARAFLDGESRALFDKLGRLKARTWRKRTLRQRLDAALQSLPSATHLLLPADWRLREQIDPAFHSVVRGPDGSSGTFRGLAVYDTWREDTSLYLLSIPNALRVDQWHFDGETFKVSIDAIEGQTAADLMAEGLAIPGPDNETLGERLRTRVLVDLREAPRIRVLERFVRRIAVPEGET